MGEMRDNNAMGGVAGDLDVGEIIPPPEVKAVVDKTASFVGLHGIAGERKICEKHGGTGRFSFLKESSPYYAYYQRKIKERKETLEEANWSALKAAPVPENGAVGSEAERKKPRGPVVRVSDVGTTTVEVEPAISKTKADQVREEAKRVPPKEGPKLDVYTVDLGLRPPSAFQLEVIKLTAQFAARGGYIFANALSRREARNPLFDFLRPLNRHFSLFQAFKKAYEKLINPDEGRERLIECLRERARGRKIIHDEVLHHYDWNLIQEKNEKDRQETEDDGIQGSLIDWHDFVVLETVDLSEHEHNLPAPIADPNQIPSVMEAAENARKEQEQNHTDVDMDIEMEDVEVVAADVNADIPSERVRKDFVSSSPDSLAPEVQKIVLPSGQRVPVSQADQSIRAELRDPKYKAERARAAEKNRLDNLASGDEIARNVAARNYQKTEVFNHVDLHRGIASTEKPVPAEVTNPTKPALAGPQLPTTRKSPSDSSELALPEKRARVEAAVVLLSGASNVQSTEELADVDAPGKAPSGLVSEKEWLKKVGRDVKINVKIPSHSNRDWKLRGQNVALQMPLRKTIRDLKLVLSNLTKVPANKQKLQYEPVGFMKDEMTFAYYNVPEGAKILFEVKERGGKKR